jgi:hypothetical protein
LAAWSGHAVLSLPGGIYVPLNSTDILVTNVALDLEPGSPGVPFTPLVHSFRATITDAALVKCLQAILVVGRSKMPMEVELNEARFVSGGAAITATAGTARFLRAKATTIVGISGPGTETISVEVREIRALGKLPIESIVGPILDRALDRAATFAGVQRDPARHRGLLIAPNVLLQGQGLPLRFAEPGGWTVDSQSGSLEAAFAGEPG